VDGRGEVDGEEKAEERRRKTEKKDMKVLLGTGVDGK
jgi:hypothetical protein